MKPFAGYKAEQPSNSTMLPAGCYVAKIKGAKVEGNEPDQQLKIMVDITEGEYAGFYTKQYEGLKNRTDMQYQPKYKGVLSIQIPNEANTNRQHAEWDVRTFNNTMWVIETSNPGYHWGWDENSLKGLTVGINVREGKFNGNPFTKIGRFEVADDVRNGLCKVMKPMQDRGDSAPATDAQTGFTVVEADDDIPF